MKTKPKITNLLPSEILAIALSSLKKCEKDPRYKIDMAEWHTPQKNNKCAVCFAGSVMAKALGAGVDEDLSPSSYPDSQDEVLCGLNYFRINYGTGYQSELEEALLRISGRKREGKIVRFVSNLFAEWDIGRIDYKQDPTAFKKDMAFFIRELKKAGL